MKQIRLFSIFIASFFFASFFAGMIIGIDHATAKPEKTQQVNLYAITRHDKTIYDMYENAFKKDHPEVNDIKWLELTNVAAWRSAIITQTYSIDILWGGGPSIFNVLAGEGLLTPFGDPTFKSELDSKIPDTIAGAQMNHRDTSGDYLWVAAAISSFGYTVNYENLETYGLEVPRSWEELASPEYYLGTTQHAIGMGDAPATTSNTRVYQIILQKFGWEAGWDILTRMAGNSKLFEGGSGPTRDSVIEGEQAIAMTIDFYGYQAMVQNEDCQYIAPEGETIINADPIAIAKGTENHDLAKEFVKFVMSAEGQALWLDNSISRIPMISEAFDYAETQLANPRDDLKTVFTEMTTAGESIPFDEDLALSIYDIVTFYFQGSFTKAQESLYTAWNDLVTAYKNGQISEAEFRSLTREMSNISITLEDAKVMQQKYNSNTALIDTYVSRFKTEAINRYTSISEKLAEETKDSDNDGTFFEEFEVVIKSPSNGTTVSGAVDIEADIIEYGDWSFVYGVTNVTFYVDNSILETQFDEPFKVSWNTANFADGPHTIRVLAEEYTGRNTSSVIQVNVGSAKTLPKLSIDSPLNGTFLENLTTIEITADESSEYKIDYLTVAIYGSDGLVFFKNITSGFDSVSEDWDITKSRNGIHTVIVTAYYESGNSQCKQINLIVGKEPEETWKASPGFDIGSVTLGIMAILGVLILKRRNR